MSTAHTFDDITNWLLFPSLKRGSKQRRLSSQGFNRGLLDGFFCKNMGLSVQSFSDQLIRIMRVVLLTNYRPQDDFFPAPLTCPLSLSWEKRRLKQGLSAVSSSLCFFEIESFLKTQSTKRDKMKSVQDGTEKGKGTRMNT
jgi:hypothetical protein